MYMYVLLFVRFDDDGVCDQGPKKRKSLSPSWNDGVSDDECRRDCRSAIITRNNNKYEYTSFILPLINSVFNNAFLLHVFDCHSL